MGHPEPKPGDNERRRWRNVPEEHTGKVVESLDELRDLIPPDDEYGEVMLDRVVRSPGAMNAYDLYGRSFEGSKRLSRVAYGCHGCRKIVVGPPEIQDRDSITPSRPMTGRTGYDVYCTNCYAKIDGSTFEMS